MRAGGLALLVAGIAWGAWFFLESTGPRLGFEDVDDPSVMLRFLGEQPTAFAQTGVALFVLAVSLVVGVLAVGERLAQRASPLAVRSVTVFGLLAAASFLGLGVTRMSAGPIAHIEGLQSAWGEAAYLAILMMGTHGLAQAALLTLSIWAIGVAVVGRRTRTIPLVVAVLAILPGVRLLAILGPLGLGDGPDLLWVVFMASIAGTLIWLLALGFALSRSPTPVTTTG